MRIDLRRTVQGLVAFATVVFGATDPASAEDSTVGVKAGHVTFSRTDGEKSYSGTAAVYGVEYGRHFSPKTALDLGYRRYDDPTTKRAAYQSAYAGLRYYVLGVGHPIDEELLGTNVEMTSPVALHVDGQISLGRALFETRTEGGGFELGADTLGFALGLGQSLNVGRLSLDLSVCMESFQSFGGTSNSLALSGRNIFVMLTAGFWF